MFRAKRCTVRLYWGWDNCVKEIIVCVSACLCVLCEWCLGQNVALQGYTGPGRTWANEIIVYVCVRDCEVNEWRLGLNAALQYLRLCWTRDNVC